MRPREIERYVAETARVLKPGGRSLASFVLLNEDTELRLSISRRRELGPEQGDSTHPYRSGDPVTPEHMIVVYERDVRPIYAEAGLEIESIRYGSWCGRQKPYAGLGQDLVVARRR